MVNTSSSSTNDIPLLPNHNNEPSRSIPSPTESPNSSPTEYLSQQLNAIIAKLNSLDSEMISLKQQQLLPEPKGSNSQNGKQAYEELEENERDQPWWNKNPSRRPHSKVEFPKFEKEDPCGWLMKAEKYFRYYQIPEDLKVDVAAMNLEGDALDIFNSRVSESGCILV